MHRTALAEENLKKMDSLHALATPSQTTSPLRVVYLLYLSVHVTGAGTRAGKVGKEMTLEQGAEAPRHPRLSLLARRELLSEPGQVKRSTKSWG